MQQPRTIHDFYGFPPSSSPSTTPLPRSALAARWPSWPTRSGGEDHGQLGIDHGAWSVLVHAFPEADIPVVQLAVNATKPFGYTRLGAALAPLRHEGVVIVASGNVVHNLGRMDPPDPTPGPAGPGASTRRPRAMLSDPSSGRARRAPRLRLAVPTPDHFIPCSTWRAGPGGGHPARTLVDGYAYGSLSMTSYVLDGPAAGDRHARAVPPAPRRTPDETNL